MSNNIIDFPTRLIYINQEKERKAYRYLIFFAMLCMTTMLCKSIFSYRLVELHGHILQAGQLIAPLWFILCDMIAEIYGYKIGKQIIIAGFICQVCFTLTTLQLINLPYPVSWHHSDAFQIVFGDLWRVAFAVLVALIISGFMNIRLITKWKFLTRGKYFWLRSIGASGIAEIFYSIFATLIIQYGKEDMHTIGLMILASCFLKILYSSVLSFPASIVVDIVKKAEGITF